ncbi:MAG: YraN family protein [Bacteroidetes bacterium]|nr:MAG: YraN family protein [Bacteroidota bacterium]REK04820.1 MAG: YraN family protein [Bacteroidota bacterium]REK36293.1 MAG: YraN family protein [Bacteroidota bacterium]
MMDAKELGKLGEEMAVSFLSEKAYEILFRNYIYDRAETDIVAKDGNEIVFIEVKSRMSAYLSDPALLVSRKKQNQIIKVADHVMKEHFPDHNFRFDIIIVITNNKYTSIEHIEEAFYPMI